MKRRILIVGIIIVCIVLIQYFDVYTRVLKVYYPDTYAEYVNKYAEEYKIDRIWVFALIKSESNFKPNSISASGATGLMQLMENTASEMAKEERYRRDRFKRCRNQYTNRHEIFCKIALLL